MLYKQRSVSKNPINGPSIQENLSLPPFLLNSFLVGLHKKDYMHFPVRQYLYSYSNLQKAIYS